MGIEENYKKRRDEEKEARNSALSSMGANFGGQQKPSNTLSLSFNKQTVMNNMLSQPLTQNKQSVPYKSYVKPETTQSIAQTDLSGMSDKEKNRYYVNTAMSNLKSNNKAAYNYLTNSKETVGDKARNALNSATQSLSNISSGLAEFTSYTNKYGGKQSIFDDFAEGVGNLNDLASSIPTSRETKLKEYGLNDEQAQFYGRNYDQITGIIENQKAEEKINNRLAEFGDDELNFVKEYITENSGVPSHAPTSYITNKFNEKFGRDLSEDEFKILSQYVERKVNQLKNEQRDEDLRYFMQEHKVAGTAIETAADIGSEILGLQGYLPLTENLRKLGYADKDLPLDTNSNAYFFANMGRSIQDEANNIIDNPAGQFWYGAGTSTAKSMLSIMISQGAANSIASGLGLGAKATQNIAEVMNLGNFGATSYASTLKECQDKGYGESQAQATAFTAGVAEMAFEKLSLDKAWDSFLSGSVGKVSLVKTLSNMFVGSGIEGSEEVFTNFANNFSDYLINGGFSEFETQVRTYKEMGYTEDEARNMASSNLANEYAQSFAAGAVSGLASNAMMTAKGAIQYNNAAKDIMNNSEAVDALHTATIGTAKEGTTAYDIVNNKTAEELTRSDVAKILESSQEAETYDTKDVIKDRLVELGETEKSAEKIANQLYDMSVSSEIISEEESAKNEKLINSNDNAATVYAEMVKGDIVTPSQALGNDYADYKKKFEADSKMEKANTEKVRSSKFEGFTELSQDNKVIKTANGNVDLSDYDTKAMGELGRVIEAAADLESVSAANNMVNNFDGYRSGLYIRATKLAYDAGRMGGSFDNLMREIAPTVATMGKTDAESYLKTIYINGVNDAQARAEETGKDKVAKYAPENKNRTVTVDENDALKMLKEVSSSFSGLSVLTDYFNTEEGGSFSAKEGLVKTKNTATNEYGTFLHESIGEFSQAYNPKSHKALASSIYDLACEKLGRDSVEAEISRIQNQYREFGKKVGNKNEATKTREEALYEYANDFIAGMFMNKDGITDLVEHISNDKTMSDADKAKSFNNIKEFIDYLVNQILDFIKGKRIHNATRDALKLSKMAENEIKELRKQALEMLDGAIAELEAQKGVNDKTKSNIKGNSYSLDSEGSLLDNDTKKSVKADEELMNIIDKDSTGKKLSKGQQNYFKYSKLRDENGRLKVMYHESDNYGFSVFDPKKNGDNLAVFFSDDPEITSSYFLYNDEGNTEYDSETGMYEVYINAKKPFVVDAQGDSWEEILVYTDNHNNMISAPDFYDSVLENKDFVSYSNIRILPNGDRISVDATRSGGNGFIDNNKMTRQEFIDTFGKQYYEKAKKAGFKVNEQNVSINRNSGTYYNEDVLSASDIARYAYENGYDSVIVEDSVNGSTIAAVFNSNQIKSVDNENPTRNKDINYSLDEDSNGNTLTENQQKFFKNSKIRDEYGRLKVMYHESDGYGFSVFNANKNGDGLSMLFTDDPEVASSYYLNDDYYDENNDDSETGTYEVYLNSKKPFIVDADGDSWEEIIVYYDNNDNMLSTSEADDKIFGNDNVILYSDIRIAPNGDKISVEATKSGGNGFIDNSKMSHQEFVATFGKKYYERAKKDGFNVIEENVGINRKDGTYYNQDILSASDIAKYAHKNGYDAVIVENTVNGSSIVAVFNSNQIKTVDNENPTSSPDVRYSLEEDDPFMASFEDIDSYTNWEETEVSNMLKNWLSKDDMYAQSTMEKIARDIKKQYGSKIKTSELVEGLNSVFSHLKESGSLSMNEVMVVMRELAKPILENTKDTDAEQEKLYKDFVSTVRSHEIALDSKQMQEVVSAYDSYYNFKRAMSGKINLNKEGTQLDTIWTELCDASGGALSYGENSNNQPLALAEYINALQPTYQGIDGQSLDEAATDLSLEIFRRFFVEQSMADAGEKVAKQMKRRSADLKAKYEAKYQEALKEVRQAKMAALDNLSKEIEGLTIEQNELSFDKSDAGKLKSAEVENLRKQYIERYNKLKQQNDEKIAKIKTDYRNRNLRDLAKKTETELKNKVLKEVTALQNIVAHPKSGSSKSVPIGLLNDTISMLEAINLDNGRNKALHERLTKLANTYNSLKQNNSDAYKTGFDYDERIAEDIEELRQIFDGGKSYSDLYVPELQRVLDIVRALKTQIVNANNLIMQGKLVDAKLTAYDAMKEVKESGGTVKALEWMNSYGNAHLNAYRMFRKLSGYTDGAMMKLYKDLDEGSLREMQIQKDLGAIYEDVLEGKENQAEIKKFISTKDEDLVDVGITDEKGKPVKVTREMRMSIIMHSKNADNLKHIIFGGVNIPDMYYLRKGKPAEAYAKGNIYRFLDYQEYLAAIQSGDYKAAQQIEADAADKIKALENDLSEWEKKFLEDAKEMFHNATGELINDTSIKLKGYAIARVANYFPIKTDTDFTPTDFAGLVQNGTIEGMGFLKERKSAKNTILLEGITSVIQRQIANTARYAGLAIPVRNFNMAMKLATTDARGDATTLNKVIKQTWSNNDSQWLANLLQDLQGGRSEKGGFLMKLRSNFAGATLSLNPSVAIKQFASYPTAAAVVGYKALGKAMKDVGNGFFTKTGLEEVEKRSPLLWYRNQGNATQELADAKNNSLMAKLPKKVQAGLNWTQWMDTGTVRTLEYASMYYVDDNFKDLQKGSKEYWDKVAEIFNKVVEETQPNYSTMQKADIIRNPKSFVKMLVMFKTQPMQNFGIIYDAAGELIMANRRMAADATAENKAARDKAIDKFSHAVSSQIISATVFSLMTIIADLIKHRWDKYKDEKDVLTALGKGVLSTLSGMFLGGTEIYDAIKHWITHDTYYGVDVATVSMFTDTVEQIGKISTYLAKYNESNTSADKETYGQKILQQNIKLLSTIGEFTGVPVNNLKNSIYGLYLYGVDIANGELSHEYNFAKWDVESQYSRLVNAMIEGDKESYNKYANEFMLDGKAEETIQTQVKKKIGEAYKDGVITEDKAMDILETEYGMDEASAYFKVGDWAEEDYTGDYARLKGINDDYKDGKVEASDIYKEVKTLSKYGKKKNNIKDALKKSFGEEYANNKNAELNSMLFHSLVYAGYTEEEAKKELAKW